MEVVKEQHPAVSGTAVKHGTQVVLRKNNFQSSTKLDALLQNLCWSVSLICYDED